MGVGDGVRDRAIESCTVKVDVVGGVEHRCTRVPCEKSGAI